MPRPRWATFSALLVTQTISLIGSRMTAVAVGIGVYQQTGLAAPLLLAAFFNEAPGMLGASLAGVLVDRWDRKRLMLLGDLGQAAGSLLLLISFQSGAFQLWHLYAVAVIQGVFGLVQGPAETATLTLLVPEQQRERANGLQAIAFPLASVLAPALTGVAFVAVGVVGVIAIDLATFVLAAAVLAGLPIPRPAPSAEGLRARGGFAAELRGGLRFLRQRRPLLVMLVYLTVMNFLLNGPTEVAIPYFMAITGSERLTGVGLSLMSLGALAGAGLIAVIGGYRPRLRLMLGGAVVTGLAFLVFGVARSLPLMGAAVFLVLLPLPMNGALFTSLLQVKVPPDMQGRVFAVESQLALLGSTASFLVMGPLVDQVLEPLVGTPAWTPLVPLLGAQPGAGMGLLEVMAGLSILAATAVTFGQRRVRRLEADLPDYAAEAA
jgi:MFS family permease